jgi:uncharacterized protein YeaO (DUF488 family)
VSARVALRRAYEPPAENDGYRVLVDRLWPRGVKRDALHLDDWRRDVAPGDDLRRWFDHRIERWPEFRRRYLAQLIHGDARPALNALAQAAGASRLTLVFGARDREHCHAAVLRDALDTARALGLPSPRPDLPGAIADVRDDDMAALERLVRERLAGVEGPRPVADVLLVAFLPAYVDARTAGLCHEGALEVFDDGLRRALRPAA